MKPTYGKTVYFINSFMVCASGEIEGLKQDKYLLNTGKKHVLICKDRVFVTMNGAIRNKIESMKDAIEASEKFLNSKKRAENPNIEAYVRGEILSRDVLEYYPDAIEFLKSQLQPEIEGF